MTSTAVSPCVGWLNCTPPLGVGAKSLAWLGSCAAVEMPLGRPGPRLIVVGAAGLGGARRTRGGQED